MIWTHSAAENLYYNNNNYSYYSVTGQPGEEGHDEGHIRGHKRVFVIIFTSDPDCDLGWNKCAAFVASCRPELVLTVLDGLDVRVPRNISRFLSEQQHARFLECRYRDARNFLQVSTNAELLLWKVKYFEVGRKANVIKCLTVQLKDEYNVRKINSDKCVNGVILKNVKQNKVFFLCYREKVKLLWKLKPC